MYKDIVLTDLVTLDCWERIQGHFAEVLGIGIRTVDKEGNLITRPSNQSRICEEILAVSPAGITKCGRCLPASLEEQTKARKWQDGYCCHVGLYNFCVPVSLSENRVVAYVILGPVLLGQRRESKRYRQMAEELSIDLDKFIDYITEVKLFSFTGIKSATELINDIVCNVAQLGYSRLKLERIIPLPKIGKVVHKFHMDKILNALLDVSFSTAKASVGSIMLLDEVTGELYIKVAKGLSKDIVKSTRLKIGEGIAGLAVEQKRFLLIDDNLTDREIKARLTRPAIKSAVVVPFKIKDEPLGVMNIGTSGPTNRITPDKVETLQRLIELTESTLSDLVNL